MGELTAAGREIDEEVVHRHRRAVTPETVATIIYTSGTTGRPRAV
ncbi:AMP-dependent synthetase/ligase [Streptomyces tanashiensis]